MGGCNITIVSSAEESSCLQATTLHIMEMDFIKGVRETVPDEWCPKWNLNID